MKKNDMHNRRLDVLSFLNTNPGSTASDIGAALGVDSLRITHALKMLIWGGSVKKCGVTWRLNALGNKTKVSIYQSTGKAFNLKDAIENKKALEAGPEIKKPDIPGYRLIKMSDKPARKNQGGQGSGHHQVHIGCGSWGLK